MRFARWAASGVAIGCLATVLTAPAVADSSIIGLAQPSVRSPISAETFYFVLTDRYSNGRPANDAGGATGGPATTGLDPSSESYFHGGDLAGLTSRCDPADRSDTGLGRLKRMGFTAVWITPPFVQRSVQGSSAAYHGYWFLDLSRPDPHLGTEAEFADFVDCAHRLGMKAFVDVVVNHTADVISYDEGTEYVPTEDVPYRTAAGRPFDPWAYTSGTAFPALSPTRSFAKSPTVEPEFARAKVPTVLNDLTKYHNRGDIDWSSCSGRCEMDGDFAGLDDLMTEDETVVRSLADAYGSWISRYGVDGFRIDTAKHVDPAFFKRWLPLVQSTATAAGRPGFTVFGEAWQTDPAQLSELMLGRGLPSVLDFPFQDTAWRFAAGQATGGSMAMLFADDDYYTSPTTNAYGLTTFLGNHDMGRVGYFLSTQSSATGEALLQRDLLAHDVLYLTRGVPVVYYGDEVGMTGSVDGTDRNARQDMFPTQVSQWQSEPRIGEPPIGSGSAFTGVTDLEGRLTRLATLRATHPALASGAMIPRFGDGGVFAVSRIDADARREYVVAFNGSDSPAAIRMHTSTPSSAFDPILGGVAARSTRRGVLTVSLPARSTVVLKAANTLPRPARPTVSLRSAADPITGRYRVTASVPGVDPSTVTFLMRRPGGSWSRLGSDDARPFRVYVPPVAERVELAAVVVDTVGQRAASAPQWVSLRPFLE